MQIIFNLPHVFRPSVSDADEMQLHVDNAYALRSLLECMVELNIGYMKFHNCPPLYQSGVRYGRTIWWEPIPALYQRRRGDCKSLATALIAQYRMQGIGADPVFRFVMNGEGGIDGTDFHILVQNEDGFEDPSKVLGMGQDENARFFRTDGSVMSWEPSVGYHRLR
jgi:hypothetical protein